MKNNFDGILKEYLEFVLDELEIQWFDIIKIGAYNQLKNYLLSDTHNRIKYTDTQEKILRYINANLIILSLFLRYKDIEIKYNISRLNIFIKIN
jgi:hypothetical protein